MLFLWAYQRWAAERVLQVLRPARFELAPALEPQRFEPAPRASVPEVVMEQLRLAELMEAPLPEEAAAPPSVGLEGLAPQPGLEADAGLKPDILPGDTLSYDRRPRRPLPPQARGAARAPHPGAAAGRHHLRGRPPAQPGPGDHRPRHRGHGGARAAAGGPGQEGPGREVGQRTTDLASDGRELRSYLRGRRYRVDTAPDVARGLRRAGRAGTYATDCSLRPPRDETATTPSAGTSCRGSAATA